MLNLSHYRFWVWQQTVPNYGLFLIFLKTALHIIDMADYNLIPCIRDVFTCQT